MRNDLTASFTTVLDKQETVPVQLLKLEWQATQALPVRTLYLADRALTLGSNTWVAVIKSWGTLDFLSDEDAALNITALNTAQDFGNGSERMSDVFQVYSPERAVATLFKWFEGEGLVEDDLACLLTGRIADPITWNATTLDFVVAGNSERFKLKRVGEAISLGEYPNAPENNVGKIKPVVIGAVQNVPGLLVRKIHTTRLTSVALPSATTLSVADTEGFPSAGSVALNDDVISYSGKTATQFTGCSGVNDFHYADDEVLEKVNDHRYLFSDPGYPIQNISNVKVAGQLADASDYMVDLNAGEVVFSKKPQRVRSIDTRFLQAQFDTTGPANSALDPELAHQPSLRTRYARISQTHPKLQLRQTDSMPDIGKIGRVLLRVDHFMEEKLASDSVTVHLSGIGQVGTLSPPASDDAAKVSGSTDITHDTLDTFQFPINVPTPVITATTDGERTVRQRADTLGSNLGISNGSDLAFPNPITLTFPPAPSGAAYGEYEFVMRAHSQTFNAQQGFPAFSFMGRTVSQWSPSLNNGVGEWRYFSTFKVQGGSHPTSAVLSLTNGFARVDLLLVQRTLYYPATTTATQGSQDTLKNGGNLTTSGSRALNASTEKSTQSVTDFFDITQHVNADWNWFTQREVEVNYNGQSDGRTAFILHVAFEIEYARRRLAVTDEVTADVDGVIDDSAGTVTGTGLSLLKRPDHVFKWSLIRFLGLTLADLDTNSFDSAGVLLDSASPSGFSLAGVIQNPVSLETLWQDWGAASRTRLDWDHLGRARLSFLRINNTLNIEGQEVKTIADDSLLLKRMKGAGNLFFSKTPAKDIANPVTVLFQRNWNEKEADAAFNRLVTLTDPVANSNLGASTPFRRMRMDWCVDEDQANDLAKFYLAEFAQSNNRVTVPVLTKHMDLQSGDIVKLNFPDWNLQNVFSRVEAVRTLIAPEPKDQIDHLEMAFRLFPIASLLQTLDESSDVSESLEMIAGFIHDLLEAIQVQEIPKVTEGFNFGEALDVIDSFYDASTAQFDERPEVLFSMVGLDQQVLDDPAKIVDQAFMDLEGFGLQAYGISGYGGKEVLA